MTHNADKRARAEAMLGELAELGLMLARELAVQARETEDPEERVALVAAFQKTSRAVRLTLALDFRLERDAAREAREAEREAQAQAAAAERRDSPAAKAAMAAVRNLADPPPAERQKTRVRRVLNRLLWNESEGDEEEYDVLVDDLDARLCELSRDPGFTELPIEALAQRLKTDMRLTGELVVTTAQSMIPAHGSPPAAPPRPPADTG